MVLQLDVPRDAVSVGVRFLLCENIAASFTAPHREREELDTEFSLWE